MTPANATNLSQMQSLSATVIGGSSGSSVLGQLQAQYTNNQFSYTLQWSGSSWEVQEVGWTFQMPTNADHFSWNRAARWTVYPPASIARGVGTATPDSTNADYTRMDLPNDFDFNSTKYDCNWASLTTAGGSGLMVSFNPLQRFHCRGGGGNGGNYLLYVNQVVSLPNDFTTPVVPDLLLTLSSGNVVQGSFSVGSVPATTTTSPSNAIASVASLNPFSSPSGGGRQFGLGFNALAHNSFSVWGSTNFMAWSWLGPTTEGNPGQYQFLDAGSTNLPWRFYRLSSP